MKKKNNILYFLIFFISSSVSAETFLSLKKNKVNVRYGPSFDSDIKFVYKKLCSYFQISYGEGQNTLHQLNFKTFCNIYGLKKTLTFNALRILDSNSIISLDQRFNFKTTVQFRVSNASIFKYLENNKSQDKAIKVLLRTYGGIIDYPTKSNETEIIEPIEAVGYYAENLNLFKFLQV